MAVPNGTVRIQMQGAMPGGESWEAGWWAARGGDGAQSALIEAQDVVANPDFDDFAADLLAIMSPATTLQAIQAQIYGAGGQVVDAARVPVNGAPVAGIGTGLHPNYVALCVTLRDGQPGPRHRNRMYLPATGAPLGPEGNLSATNLNNLADSAAALLIGGTAQVVGPAGGNRAAVTQVTIDARMDTQRGRNERTVVARASRS